MTQQSRRPTLGERRQRVGAAGQPVVRPPLFLVIVCFTGTWLTWPWILFNEVQMRSDAVQRQAWTILVGIAGAFCLAGVVLWLVHLEAMTVSQARYAYVILLGWKVGITYLLVERQGDAFDLWSYFGGVAKSPVIPLIIGYFASQLIFANLPFGLLWLVLR